MKKPKASEEESFIKAMAFPILKSTKEVENLIFGKFLVKYL